jgi:hypothetical protein
MSERAYHYGDAVVVPGRDRRNPHTFAARYHTGAVRLYDRYGYPVRLSPDRAAEVLDDE